MFAKAIFQQLARQPHLKHPCSAAPQLITTRQTNWMVYLHKRYDRKTGEWKYADWNDIIRGVEEPMKNGKYEVDRHMNQKHHIKKNQIKHQMKTAEKGKRDAQKIEELLKYIQFMKDRPNEFQETRGSKGRKD